MCFALAGSERIAGAGELQPANSLVAKVRRTGGKSCALEGWGYGEHVLGWQGVHA